MAIQPIDLQALFSQIDKVGKAQSMIRDGQQIHDALQQNQVQRRLEENIRTVNEAQDMGDGNVRIHDDSKGSGSQAKSDKKGKNEEEEESSTPSNLNFNFFKDPALGKNIDITG